MRRPLKLPVSNRAADEGLFFGLDGKPSRREPIPWPAPPEDVSTSCDRIVVIAR